MVFHPNRPGQAAIAGSRELLDGARTVGLRMRTSIEAEGIEVDGVPGEYALPVRVDEKEGVMKVRLAHPAGLAVQAKHGSLTRAAAAEGLHVTGD